MPNGCKFSPKSDAKNLPRGCCFGVEQKVFATLPVSGREVNSKALLPAEGKHHLQAQAR